MQPRLALTAVSCAAVLALGACGDDEEPPDPAASDPLAGLSDHLPTGSAGVSEVDLAAARSELGLPLDADALDIDAIVADKPDPEEPQLRLTNVTATALPLLAIAYQRLDVPGGLAAFDGTAISAVSWNQEPTRTRSR